MSEACQVFHTWANDRCLGDRFLPRSKSHLLLPFSQIFACLNFHTLKGEMTHRCTRDSVITLLIALLSCIADSPEWDLVG